MSSTPAEYVIPENLKLLHELKIIKDTEPGKAFAFVPSFMHIFTSYHKRYGSVIVGLNKAIPSTLYQDIAEILMHKGYIFRGKKLILKRKTSKTKGSK